MKGHHTYAPHATKTTSLVSAGRVTTTNQGGAAAGTVCAEAGSIHDALRDCLRAISPRKTWAYIAQITGLSERVAKHRLARTRDFSAADVAALLHSQDGFEVLVAIMMSAKRKPEWWSWFYETIELLQVESLQATIAQRIEEVGRNREARLRRKLKGALDANERHATAVQAAIRHGSPHVNSPQLAPRFGTVGLQDRTLVATSGRRRPA